MEDGDNDHRLTVDQIVHAEWEAPNKCTADVAMNNGKQERILLDRREGGFDGQKQALAQSRSPLFVPCVRFSQIRLGSRPENELRYHERGAMRAFTMSQGEPAAGSW